MLTQQINDYIKEIQETILISNNIVNRNTYPRFQYHPSSPELLTTFKTRLTIYRALSSALIAKVGTLALPEAHEQMRNLSVGTFAHRFVGTLVVASFGIGECSECAFSLGTKLINAGHGNLAFITINFTHAQKGMESGHEFIVANLPKMPPLMNNNLSIYEFFKLLPEDTIIADAYLRLQFSPKNIPIEFVQYLNAYGGQATLSGCMHLYNTTKKTTEIYASVAETIRKQMLLQLPEEKYLLKEKIKIEETSLTTLLKEQSGLNFFAVRDNFRKVDAIAEINDEFDQKKADKLRRNLKGYGNFFKNEHNKQIFVLEGINLSEGNPSIGQRIQSYLYKKS